jgi:tRNA threonylcarbamoyladenosine biosynthesis protein TsaB
MTDQPSMLLAIDTSTRCSGIALYDAGRGLLAEHNWYSAHQHTTELMPEIAHLLAQAGARPADLQAVAVALGPGSFTGVRVALAAAKGLALAGDLALLGVPTLDAAAYPQRDGPLPVVALVQAGRGRICWAAYTHATVSPYALDTLATLADQITGETVFTGELTPADRVFLADRLGPRAHCLAPALALRRAGYLAELAWARLARGERDDLATLSPIYLQDPVTFKSTQAGG